MTSGTANAPVGSAPAMGSSGRLDFVDPLRALLTVLVVAHHAAQAYGPTGGEWPAGEEPRSSALGLMIWVNSMFFMGLFFFLSGYFTPGNLARKGIRAFLRDRAIRLGVPSVLVLALTGVFRGKAEYLHLWFAVDLLALNVLYAGFARFGVGGATSAERSLPSGLAMVAYVILLGVATAGVRGVYPVDVWRSPGWILAIEPAHAIQYTTLYGLGIWTSRVSWLSRFPRRQGAVALAIAACVIGALTVYRYWPQRSARWFSGGGWGWQNLAGSMLEAVVCVSLGLGLLWFFRERFHLPRRWAACFATDAFGIYCIHLPVVVGLQVVLARFPPSPVFKFLAVTVAGVAISWALTHWVLRGTRLGRRVF